MSLTLTQSRSTLDDRGSTSLQPLTLIHIDSLAYHHDRKVGRFLLHDADMLRLGMPGYIAECLVAQEEGRERPFAIIHKQTGRAIGLIRLAHLRMEHRSAEISTWISREFQGRGVNPEAKFLLLRYAFEELHLIRIEFFVDVRNGASFKAMAKLGAFQEGTVHEHKLLADGTRRSSVLYRILDHDWPTIKLHLLRQRNLLIAGS